MRTEFNGAYILYYDILIITDYEEEGFYSFFSVAYLAIFMC